jgi:HSP20 family molecular chaperone IbpA
MITPKFDVNQNNESVIVKVYIPFVRLNEMDLCVVGRTVSV